MYPKRPNEPGLPQRFQPLPAEIKEQRLNQIRQILQNKFRNKHQINLRSERDLDDYIGSSIEAFLANSDQSEKQLVQASKTISEYISAYRKKNDNNETKAAAKTQPTLDDDGKSTYSRQSKS